jgi:hypothetical protein
MWTCPVYGRGAVKVRKGFDAPLNLAAGIPVTTPEPAADEQEEKR